MLIKRILSITLLCLTMPAWSQPCQQKQASLSIENDSLLTLGGGTDRFYSNGVEARFSCHTNPDEKASASNPAPRSLYWIDKDATITSTRHGFTIGQKIYTSSDLSLRPSEINTDRDRPYAGWTYASLFYEAETLQDRYIKHEFSLGCVGPCSQADNIQTEWHEFFDYTRPQGWDLQIKNQLALQYFLEYKTNRREILPRVSLHPRYALSLGSVFTDASLGGEVILGDKNNTTSRLSNKYQETWQWQLFLHNDIKFVAYNGTLQGSLFNNSSPHTVHPSRIVLENGVGVRLNYAGQYLFEYRFTGKSTEHEEQDWKLWDHKYGSIEFGFGF